MSTKLKALLFTALVYAIVFVGSALAMIAENGWHRIN